MRPTLFHIAGMPVFGYWLFYGLGLTAAVLLTLRLSTKRGLPWWPVWSAMTLVIFGAFLGGRLLHFIYESDFSFFSLIEGGESSFGAIGGAILTVIVVALVLRVPAGDLLDAFAPGIFIGEGIQRLGCFANGCCAGPVADSIFSVRFPRIATASGEIVGSVCFQEHLGHGWVAATDPASLPVVPMQLVMTVIGVALCALGVRLFLADRFRGVLLWFLFVVYGAIRFATQSFRPNYDLQGETEGWNTGHFFSAGMVVVGVSLMLLAGPLGLARTGEEDGDRT